MRHIVKKIRHSYGLISCADVDENENVYFIIDGAHLSVMNTRNDTVEDITYENHLEPNIYVFNSMVYHKNTLYLSDARKCRIVSFSLITRKFSVLADKRQLHKPTGICIDSKGENLYVATEVYIKKININICKRFYNTKLETISVNGEFNGAFVNMIDICVDKNNIIYIIDGLCIKKIQGTLVHEIVGNQGFKTENNSARPVLFEEINAMSLDENDTLIVGDSNRIKKLNMQNETVKTLITVEDYIYTVFGTLKKNLYFTSRHNIYKMSNVWQWERYLWIGYIKEKSNNCQLAKLPKDIIREISSHLN